MKRKNQWQIKNIETNETSFFSVEPRSFKKPKPQLKNFIQGSLVVLISVLIIFTVVQAGTIKPPSGTPTATMYTLTDIYRKLTENDTFTATDPSSRSFTFSDPLQDDTHNTLTQIYNVIPTIDANKVLTGISYLGVSGTMADNEGDNVSTAQTADASVNYFTAPAGFYDGDDRVSATDVEVAALDADIVGGKIKDGEFIFGVEGTYTATYTWSVTDPDYSATKGSLTYEGVGENLDWVMEFGDLTGVDSGGHWDNADKNYTYRNDAGTLQTITNFNTDSAPGGWNGSSDDPPDTGSTGWENFDNSALQRYRVAESSINGTSAGGDPVVTYHTGDLVFPDDTVWYKSEGYGIPHQGGSSAWEGCTDNATSATTDDNCDDADVQYNTCRNAPSALAIADAWDGKKNLVSGPLLTHSYEPYNGKNDDYYDRPAESWYKDIGNGIGTSRLPMIEEYEQARQWSDPDDTAQVSLLYGTINWDRCQWSAEQTPYGIYKAVQVFTPGKGAASYDIVDDQGNEFWVVVSQ